VLRQRVCHWVWKSPWDQAHQIRPFLVLRSPYLSLFYKAPAHHQLAVRVLYAVLRGALPYSQDLGGLPPRHLRLEATL